MVFPSRSLGSLNQIKRIGKLYNIGFYNIIYIKYNIWYICVDYTILGGNDYEEGKS